MIVNKKVEELVSKYHENKLSHAFLFVTNDLKKCNNDVKELIKQICCEDKFSENCTNCNICHLIDQNSIPNIVEIFPDGAVIKKNQIADLKETFKTKPLYIKNNIYIINYAEKLNASSANTMLKFLEEPEDNIIGFFITTNKENLLDTIKSRCQIININYSNQNILDILDTNLDEYNIIKEIANEYLEEILIKKSNGIYLNKKIFIGDLKERLFINKLFIYIYYQINDFLAGKTDTDLAMLNNISKSITKKLNNRVYKVLETLPFNVNIDLILDEFVLDLEEII